MLDTKTSTTEDPVVVYDVMREAGNRLIAAILENTADGGLNDPAIQAVRDVRAELRAVPVNDIQAQHDKTNDLVMRERQMRGI